MQIIDPFRLCPPSLWVHIPFTPQTFTTHPAIFLHNDSLCNGMWSVSRAHDVLGGGGAQTETIRKLRSIFEKLRQIGDDKSGPV